MPSPRPFDLARHLPPLVTCPYCYRPMRIQFVEVDKGREHIRLVCDDCRTEASETVENAASQT